MKIYIVIESGIVQGIYGPAEVSVDVIDLDDQNTEEPILIDNWDCAPVADLAQNWALIGKDEIGAEILKEIAKGEAR